MINNEILVKIAQLQGIEKFKNSNLKLSHIIANYPMSDTDMQHIQNFELHGKQFNVYKFGNLYILTCRQGNYGKILLHTKKLELLKQFISKLPAIKKWRNILIYHNKFPTLTGYYVLPRGVQPWKK